MAQKKTVCNISAFVTHLHIFCLRRALLVGTLCTHAPHKAQSYQPPSEDAGGMRYLIATVGGGEPKGIEGYRRGFLQFFHVAEKRNREPTWWIAGMVVQIIRAVFVEARVHSVICTE
jgi:hypothetical protein